MKDLKIVFIGFLSLTYAFSQSISGKVLDIDGNPLDGAILRSKEPILVAHQIATVPIQLQV